MAASEIVPAAHPGQQEEMFLQAKAYLMQADDDGNCAYDQLVRLMEDVLDGNQSDTLSNPEGLRDVLGSLQKHAFRNGLAARTGDVLSENITVKQRLQERQRLLKPPEPTVVTKVEQPDPFTTVTTTVVVPPVMATFSSIAADNVFWRYAGCGLSDEEALFLDRSVAKLTFERKLEEVRFVGRIQGTHADYLVISSKRFVEAGEKVYLEVNTMPKAPRRKMRVPVQSEPAYKGANRLSFWVCGYAGDEWILLPDVTPQQINTARKIKKLFTGNLGAAVHSNPHFPWSEAVYLRAQLARIVSGTFIAPNGALEVPEDAGEDQDEVRDEDDDEMKTGAREAKYSPITIPSQEYAPNPERGVAALASLEEWVHAEPCILPNGRQTQVPEKQSVEGEESGDTAKLSDVDDEDGSPAEMEDDSSEGWNDEEDADGETNPEILAPIKNDYLYAVLDIPQDPTPDDLEGDEYDGGDDAEEQQGGSSEGRGQDDEGAEVDEKLRPQHDDDVPDDDPTKKKIRAWSVRVTNDLFKPHGVVVVSSIRWPGAVAFAAEGGRKWGCVYFGDGVKNAELCYTPAPAPPIQEECRNITEYDDPTAETEKLVRRGEEPKTGDSEDEHEGDEEMEEEDAE